MSLVQCLCLNIKTCKKNYGEIVFDNNFCKIKKIQDAVKDDDDINMMILTKVKYIRSIKISMMYYILVPYVFY
jgi:hypothetical protein